MSNAIAECVNEPTDTKSTPVSAIFLTVLSLTPKPLVNEILINMKDMRLINLLLLSLTCEAIIYTTYEPVVEQLYFTGNDIRKNPVLLKARVNGLDQ